MAVVDHEPSVQSTAERAALGRRMRKEVPRSTHGTWEPAPARGDPIDLLESQARSRVPDLVPIRYGRMLVSPFTFFRGAASIMAADLAPTPNSGLKSQVCGDAHLSNFGVFASPDRRLVFDVNDFDETVPGPWEWDVKRLAASLSVAGRENGFSAPQRERALLEAVSRYRGAMREFASMRNLEVWYARVEAQETFERNRTLVTAKGRRTLERSLAKARTHDNLQAFGKLTKIVDGVPRFRSDPPLIVPIDELTEAGRDEIEDAARTVLGSYRRVLATDRRHLLEQFRFLDLARKVVGVGSVGMRAWIALLTGRDEGDPLLLQIKQADSSVLERFVGKSRYANRGQRVVAGQLLMQAASDIFLGWQRVKGLDGVSRDFYVRQLRDWKGAADVAALSPKAMANYGRLCALTLARAHARSGDRVAIAAYLGKSDAFDRAIASFAESYADQNERDYEALGRAVRTGRVAAETGV